MSYMYRICCVPFFFFRKTACQKYFFSNPFPKTNAQIVNLKNPNLDLIRKIHPECGFYGFMIRFWICPKNAKSVFRFEIRIWIFPRKRTQNPDIFESPYFVLKESAFCPHETSESAHSHSFVTALQRGLRLCSRE